MDAAGCCYSMPPDNNKKTEEHPPDERYERLMKEAEEALRQHREMLGLAHSPPKISQAPKPPPQMRFPSLRPPRYRLILPVPYADDLPSAVRDEIMQYQMEAAEMSPNDGILYVIKPYIAHARECRREKGWTADKAVGWILAILASLVVAQDITDFRAPEDMLLASGFLRDLIASPPSSLAEKKELHAEPAEKIAPEPARAPESAIAAEGEQELATLPPPHSRSKLPKSVTSLAAALKMEEHINSIAMQPKNFAKMVETTERTLRRFRKTGKIQRDTFEKIAKAMGTTPEALQK
jgi:hypothetical protein